jgi:hypothetical protein
MIHEKNLKQKISWHCPFKEAHYNVAFTKSAPLRDCPSPTHPSERKHRQDSEDTFPPFPLSLWKVDFCLDGGRLREEMSGAWKTTIGCELHLNKSFNVLYCTVCSQIEGEFSLQRGQGQDAEELLQGPRQLSFHPGTSKSGKLKVPSSELDPAEIRFIW